MNDEEGIMTTANMLVRIQSVKSGNGEESGCHDKEADQEPLVPAFYGEISSSEAVK